MKKANSIARRQRNAIPLQSNDFRRELKTPKRTSIPAPRPGMSISRPAAAFDKTEALVDNRFLYRTP
jgi:hypothetical protein